MYANEFVLSESRTYCETKKDFVRLSNEGKNTVDTGPGEETRRKATSRLLALKMVVFVSLQMSSRDASGYPGHEIAARQH
jgi:hypothetical protein